MRTNRIVSAITALLTLTLLAFLGNPVVALAANRKKSDSTVKIFVQYKLAKSGILDNGNVNVNVAANTITLTGSVPTIHDRTEAAREAGSVDDSYKIVDDLKVATPNVADGVLAKAVYKRVVNHSFYSVFDWLTVSAKNGIVTLNGWVNNPWEVNDYASEASKVPGVRQIVNNLKVEFAQGYARYRAIRLIYDSPRYWGYSLQMNPPIHVVSNDGTLIIEGNVDSKAERGYLADLVTFRTNAIRVVDNLQIYPNN